MLTRDGLRDRLADLRLGADLGGRDPDDVRVTFSLPRIALNDRERAKTLARNHMAFYVGAMGMFYRDALVRQGYEDEAREVANEWANGNQDAAISDELLDALGIAGTPADCRERLDVWTAIDGVDALSVSFPRGADPDEIRTTMRELIPE